MLIYEKKVLGETKIFCNPSGNIPSDSDEPLVYLDQYGDELAEDPTLDDTYVNNDKPAITRVSDGQFIAVADADGNIVIPESGEFEPEEPYPTSIEVTTLPTTSTYSIDDTLSYSGMEVTVDLSDGSDQVVSYSEMVDSGLYTFDPANGATVTAEMINESNKIVVSLSLDYEDEESGETISFPLRKSSCSSTNL